MPGKRDGIQLTQETVHVLAGQECSSKISKNILDHFPANGTFVDLGVFQ